MSDHSHQDEVLQHRLMELFDELSFFERVRRVLHGLGQPKESGEFKWARLQMVRLLAPFAAIVVPTLIVFGLMMMPASTGPDTKGYKVEVAKEEALDEEVDKPEEPPEPIDQVTEVDVDLDVPTVSDPTQTAFSPQPADVNAVASIRSPVVMKSVYGNRTAGGIQGALNAYGAPPGTEEAVLRALRWLKKVQKSDGSWEADAPVTVEDKAKWTSFAVPYTSLALLAFLAHGETPASAEFGPTVEKAIRWLVKNQREDGEWPLKLIDEGKNYSQPIAAYALSEAFGMTGIPPLKTAAEKAIEPILKGQNARGSWDYILKQTDRDDLSLAAWCAQALKAAKMAKLANKDINNGIKKATTGIKMMQQSGGWFAYSSQTTKEVRYDALTGAAVLALQLMGATNSPEVKKGLNYLDARHRFNWEKPETQAPLYNWYYITQSKFHAGGKQWAQWNSSFAPGLIKAQTVEKPAKEGDKAIGYWVPSRGMAGKTTVRRTDKVYCTTLCTLMLEVYYRHLPTYKEPEEFKEEEMTGDDVDVQILIKNG